MAKWKNCFLLSTCVIAIIGASALPITYKCIDGTHKTNSFHAHNPAYIPIALDFRPRHIIFFQFHKPFASTIAIALSCFIRTDKIEWRIGHECVSSSLAKVVWSEWPCPYRCQLISVYSTLLLIAYAVFIVLCPIPPFSHSNSNAFACVNCAVVDEMSVRDAE